jgi:hypothetical protein
MNCRSSLADNQPISLIFSSVISRMKIKKSHPNQRWLTETAFIHPSLLQRLSIMRHPGKTLDSTNQRFITP